MKILKRALIPLAAISLAAILFLTVFINARIPSGSMEPTISSGSLVLGLRTKNVKNGDVVFFFHEQLSDSLLVKRVAAGPGQIIEGKDGLVYVDGRAMDDIKTDPFPAVTVPDGCYFVLGDNRENSKDSRFWADPFVRYEDIMGRALFVYFPTIESLQE